MCKISRHVKDKEEHNQTFVSIFFQVAQLEAETPAGGPRTEALPPARKEGDLPPLWWDFVTRPREQP